MRVELATLHKTLGTTMIYVTHDQIEAMTMADRIVVLNKGIIEQVGSPLALYRNPVNRFVAAFLGSPRMNFFSGRVGSVDGTTAKVKVSGLPALVFSGLIADHGLSEGAEVSVGVRPEDLHLAGRDGDIRTDGQLRLSEQLGREAVLYIDAGTLATTGSETGTDDVTLLHTENFAFSEDGSVSFGFTMDDAYLFGPDDRTISGRKKDIATIPTSLKSERK